MVLPVQKVLLERTKGITVRIVRAIESLFRSGQERYCARPRHFPRDCAGVHLCKPCWQSQRSKGDEPFRLSGVLSLTLIRAELDPNYGQFQQLVSRVHVLRPLASRGMSRQD